MSDKTPVSPSFQTIADTLAVARSAETLKDAQTGIDAAREQLVELSAQVTGRVSLTKEFVAGEVAKADQESETNEPVSPEKVSEVLGDKFLSVEALNEELAHDKLVIADWEETPEINATEAEFMAWVDDAQENTRKREGRDNLPMLMPSFTKIRNTETGEEITPDLNWMKNFLENTTHPRRKGKKAFFESYITPETRKSTGNGGYAWLYSDGVAGSNKMTEREQEDFMQEKFDSKEMAPAWDLFVAAVFYYAKTGIWLFDDILVRLEDRDIDGVRAFFHSLVDDDGFKLHDGALDVTFSWLFASAGGRSPVISQ